MWLSDMSGPQVAHNGKLRATYRNKWHGGCSMRVAISKVHISVIPDTYGASLSDGVSAHHTVTVCNHRTSLHFRNSMKRRKPRWQAGLRPAGRVTVQNGELSPPATHAPPSAT
jgi:hypothetical protein